MAKQIGAGNAVIGGAIGDTPIIARAQGIPVKAVAVLGAGSLTQLVSHKDEKIESPRELKGKTVTVLAYTDTTYYALLGMLSKVGLTKNDVNIQAAGPAGVWQQFAAKKASAMAGVPDWTVSAMDAGAQVDILPADIYFKSMAQAILASDETIAKNPQLIQKLVRATLKGMKDIMADPKAATVVYVNHVPVHKGKEASIQKAFELFNQYVYAKQKVPGLMDEARLGELQTFYVTNGVVQKETPLKDLSTPTNSCWPSERPRLSIPAVESRDYERRVAALQHSTLEPAGPGGVHGPVGVWSRRHGRARIRAAATIARV